MVPHRSPEAQGTHRAVAFTQALFQALFLNMKLGKFGLRVKKARRRKRRATRAALIFERYMLHEVFPGVREYIEEEEFKNNFAVVRDYAWL